MATWKKCEQCGIGFEHTRTDARWCTPRCAAQYARDHGEFRDRTHEEKPYAHVKECAHCGIGFAYNDYADKGGKRVPQYCSNKCRQAAYRARKGAAAGYTGHWDDARNDKKTEEGKTKARTERQKQDDQDAAREQKRREEDRYKRTYDYNDPRAKHTSRNTPPKHTSPKGDRWSSKDPYIVLGVTYLLSKAEMKRAYMKLMKEYHPDISKHPDALRISKAVNAAWDKLK